MAKDIHTDTVSEVFQQVPAHSLWAQDMRKTHKQQVGPKCHPGIDRRVAYSD